MRYEFLVYFGSKVIVREILLNPGVDDYHYAQQILREELIDEGLIGFVTSIIPVKDHDGNENQAAR